MQASSQVANEEGGVGANALDGPIVNYNNANTTELNTSLSANTTLGSRSLMPNAELLTRLRSMSLSGVEAQTQQHNLYQPPESTNQVQTRGRTSNSAANVQHGVTNNNLYAAATMPYMAANPYYQTYHAYAPQQYALGAYAVNPTLAPVTANYPSYNSTVTTNMNARTPASESTNRMDLHAPHPSTLQGLPLYSVQNPMSYLQWYSANDAQNALNRGDGRAGNSVGTHKESIGSSHYGAQLGYKSPSSASAYYASPNIGFLIPYGNSSISSPVIPGLPMLANAFPYRHPIFHIPSGFGKSIAGNSYVGRISDSGETLRVSSLLEELKNNKTRKFELSDIAGHMVEFSCNQHGSRFIQQKLETVSLEEKAMVFQEVLPHALTLMKDVFGNYVIQKLFECGSLTQKMELVEQIAAGHVLNLSLHMYGCRVIQKALEAVDAEHQFRIISELDGYVMQCVENQNGNHVIQKCIECVPPEHTKFILSAFHGQVVRLSTHLYGCRVIQRVLERCTDEQKGGIMQEILQAFSSLAEDKYGNYVVQHIVEHGKPEERSEVIGKMVGQIVRMSQHKFASNVVEKCLKFGCPEERQILITDMLGQTDENENLQVMMKDQYANYVVQKVLEICDDQHREVLLSSIRAHLPLLKKYTYGKHIVAYVEKLGASGEHHDATKVLSM